jgi:cytochrome b6-f complex iron-sulfur subunit
MKPEPSSQTNTLHRRQFLQLAWKSLLGLSGALGLGGLVRYFSYQPYPTPPTRFDLGIFAELDFSQAMVVEEAQAILIPVGKNLLASSLVCPHLGCIVELKTDRFTCPCRGSQFNLQGELEKGPADRPLRQLNLEIDENGHLILDTAQSG